LEMHGSGYGTESGVEEEWIFMLTVSLQFLSWALWGVMLLVATVGRWRASRTGGAVVRTPLWWLPVWVLAVGVHVVFLQAHSLSSVQALWAGAALMLTVVLVAPDMGMAESLARAGDLLVWTGSVAVGISLATGWIPVLLFAGNVDAAGVAMETTMLTSLAMLTVAIYLFVTRFRHSTSVDG